MIQTVVQNQRVKENLPIFHALVVFVLVGCTAILSVNFLNAIVGIQGISQIVSPTHTYVLGMAIQFVGATATAAGYLSATDSWEIIQSRLPTYSDIVIVSGGIVMMFSWSFIMSALTMLIQTPTATNQATATGGQNPTILLYLIPISIFFIGPAEEFVFRGVIQGFLKERLSTPVAILGASLIFGIAHFLALSGGGSMVGIIMSMGISAGLGVLLGALYEWSEAIWVPILVHGGYNALVFGSQFLS